MVTSMIAQSALSALCFVAIRRTSIVFTVTLEYLVARQKPSVATLVAIVLMLMGSLSITGRGVFSGSATGYVASLACNTFGALYLLFVKQLTGMDSINFIFQSTLYLAPLSAIWVFASSSSINNELWPLIMEPAVFGSVVLAGMMNVSVVLNTRVNSPLTQALCSILKDALVMTWSMIFITHFTSTTLMGCALIFCGTGIYTFDFDISWRKCIKIILICFLMFSAIHELSSRIESKNIYSKFSREGSFGKLTRRIDGQSKGLFHTYLHSDATPDGFDMRNLLIVNAFSVSQPASSILVVWLSGRITDCIGKFSREFVVSNASVIFKRLHYSELIRDTPLADHVYFSQLNTSSLGMPVATFSDVVRNVLLYKYGGTWLDTDSWPVKDLSPLHSKYSNFIVSHDLSHVTNNHVIHVARPRTAVSQSVIHLMGLCRYDRMSDWYVRPRTVPGWIYNDAVWNTVYQHQNESKADERLVLLDIGAFDPLWKNNTPYSDVFVIHSRFPKQAHRKGILSPQLQRFIDFLGTPLQAPTDHFNVTDPWY